MRIVGELRELLDGDAGEQVGLGGVGHRLLGHLLRRPVSQSREAGDLLDHDGLGKRGGEDQAYPSCVKDELVFGERRQLDGRVNLVGLGLDDVGDVPGLGKGVTVLFAERDDLAATVRPGLARVDWVDDVILRHGGFPFR
jgi:hypothetical protein